MQFVSLIVRMKREEIELWEDETKNQDFTQQLSFTLELLSLKFIQLKESCDQQIKNIISFARSDARFKSILKLRKKIKQYLKKVDEAKQSLSRIHNLVQNARRHREVNTEIFCESNVLQVQNHLLTTVLLLWCNYVILVEFLISSRENLHVNLINNRKDCKTLVEESQVRQQSANAIEELLYWARFVALERDRSKAKSVIFELLIQARAHLQRVKSVCAAYSDQIADMLIEIENVKKMLRDSIFYASMSNEEKTVMYAAMSQDFRDTEHWYYCANEHSFTIEDCDMSMQTYQCSQCDSSVDDHNYQTVERVTQATNLKTQFSESTIRR